MLQKRPKIVSTLYEMKRLFPLAKVDVSQITYNFIQFETRYCLYSNICLFKNMLKLAYFFALISMLWNNPSIIAPVEKVNLDQTPPRNHTHPLYTILALDVHTRAGNVQYLPVLSFD